MASYTFNEKDYDSVFGYTSNLKDGEVTTLLDYIKIFVSDKTDQNNAIESLQNTLATINSKLTQLENDLEECAKSADLSKYVKSTSLTSQLESYATKTDLDSYAEKTELNGLASESDVTAIKNDLADNYVKKVDLPSDNVTVIANNFKVSNGTDNNIKIDLADTNLFPGYKVYLSDNIGDLGKTQTGNGWLFQSLSDNNRIYINLVGADGKLTKFVFRLADDELWTL